MVKRTSEEGGEVDETAISTGNVFDNDAAWLGNTLLYLPSGNYDGNVNSQPSLSSESI